METPCPLCGQPADAAYLAELGRCRTCLRTQYRKRNYVTDYTTVKDPEAEAAMAEAKRIFDELEEVGQLGLPERYELVRRYRKAEKALYPHAKLARKLKASIALALHRDTSPYSKVPGLPGMCYRLRSALAAQFEPGMSWDNFGKGGWVVSYVKPLSSFDLTNPAQYRKACSHNNLKPVWANNKQRSRPCYTESSHCSLPA